MLTGPKASTPCGPAASRSSQRSSHPRPVRAERRGAARAGSDVLEPHCAHGCLLSSFISPLSDRSTDRYGGLAENRLRLPLEVFDARAVWPAEPPMAVRISATN